MSFTCQCCGDCCSTMGEIISVDEQIRPFEFRIRYTTGEERIVAVDQDKRDLFGTVREGERRSLACPFLRQKAPGKRICTVHASRPDLCRRYLCSRILILHPGGTRAGKVLPGSRSFTTTDSNLSAIWHSGIRDRCIPDEGAWERHVEVVFTRAGYRAVR